MELTRIGTPGYEEVVRVADAASGLLGFIAIHSTRLGPAVGGLRMRPYRDEAEALADVLRLARGMTFKNAAADLGLGGGKAVILGDPATDQTPARLAAMGRAVDALGGRYWTAEDMGMGPADMAMIRAETAYVAGLADGPFASGDPSPVTARGVFEAIRVTLRHRLRADRLEGRRVAVQGLGHVGAHLCDRLAEAGARLLVADRDAARAGEVAARHGAEVVAPDAILRVEADLLAPCAIGGVLSAATIPDLRVVAVAGAANNQLADPDDAARLHGRGILYAPDYLCNAGGIVNVAAEIHRIADRPAFVAARLAAAASTLDRVLSVAAARDVSPDAVAEEIVATRLA